MRQLLIGIGLLVAASGAAHADTLGAIKQNKLSLTDPKGHTTLMLVEPDGTFTQSSEAGVSIGKWWIDSGRFCFQPKSLSYSQCMAAFPEDKGVGDEWEIKGPTGMLLYTAAILEGHTPLQGIE